MKGCVPVVLDVKELVSTHLAIIASTGAGKSYLASVVIEELMRPTTERPCSSSIHMASTTRLQEIANHQEFGAPAGDNGHPERRTNGGRHQRYHARARVYLHDQVKVRLNTLSLADLRYLLPGMTDKQHHYLGQAYDRVRKAKKGQPWTAKESKRRGRGRRAEQE